MLFMSFMTLTLDGVGILLSRKTGLGRWSINQFNKSKKHKAGCAYDGYILLLLPLFYLSFTPHFLPFVYLSFRILSSSYLLRMLRHFLLCFFSWSAISCPSLQSLRESCYAKLGCMGRPLLRISDPRYNAARVACHAERFVFGLVRESY